jgi:hypothetical protein
MKITKAVLKKIIKEELSGMDPRFTTSLDLEEEFLKDLKGVHTVLQDVINKHVTGTDSTHVREDVAETLYRMVKPLSDLIADVRGTTLPTKE